MVRAIDLQQSLAQVPSTEKIQQIQQQHADMQQRYFQLNLSEEDRLARGKNREFEEAEKAKIRERKENEEKRKGANRQPTRREKLSADEIDESSNEGTILNITV